MLKDYSRILVKRRWGYRQAEGVGKIFTISAPEGLERTLTVALDADSSSLNHTVFEIEWESNPDRSVYFHFCDGTLFVCWDFREVPQKP